MMSSIPSFQSKSSAEAEGYARAGDITSKFSTGSFVVGGSNTVNTLFIVAGIIALIFALKEFIFKKK